MEYTLKSAWLIGLGFLLFFGFIIMLSNLSSHNYYQEQHYNNLPSTQNYYETPKPQPIQHYEQQRDESVKLTEVNNMAEKSASNFTSLYFIDSLQFYVNEDGTINYLISLFFMFNWYFFYKFRIGFPLVHNRFISSGVTALIVTIIVNSILV